MFIASLLLLIVNDDIGAIIAAYEALSQRRQVRSSGGCNADAKSTDIKAFGHALPA
jgi:hypothetical protein